MQSTILTKRRKKNLAIPTDAENTFDKIQHPFMTKTLKKLWIKRQFLSILKTIFDKPIANIILNGEKLKTYPLKSGTRQGCPLLSLLFNIIICYYHHYNQTRDTKGIHIRKEEIKLSLFADDMITYLENPKDSTKELLEIINQYSSRTQNQYT